MATSFKTSCNGMTVPEWWDTGEKSIQNYLDNGIKKGVVKLLSVSPGGRRVRAVYYGDAELQLKGTANFNSALGAGNPDAFFKRGPGSRQRPVLVILAGVHGQEVEGIAAALSILRLMETGKNLEGKAQPDLLEKLNRLRLIIIPLANPDGRARVPYDGWVGRTRVEMTRYGQGTMKNGELYHWRGGKEVHPMRGDVGILGGYFDDAGVNMMHDEWSAPMSETSKALLSIARDEGPDMLLNLHSSQHNPHIFPTTYIPVSAKARLNDYTVGFFKRLEECGYPHGPITQKSKDGPVGECPPAFNLSSMLYHTGVDLSLVFESPHGLKDNATPYTYSDILNIHSLLVESAAEHLIEKRFNQQHMG